MNSSVYGTKGKMETKKLFPLLLIGILIFLWRQRIVKAEEIAELIPPEEKELPLVCLPPSMLPSYIVTLPKLPEKVEPIEKLEIPESIVIKPQINQKRKPITIPKLPLEEMNLEQI